MGSDVLSVSKIAPVMFFVPSHDAKSCIFRVAVDTDLARRKMSSVVAFSAVRSSLNNQGSRFL